MSELAKSFEPGTIENHWNQFWESKGLFQAGLDTIKPSFAIQLPPPNVTGSLHMGHAFNQTIMDALTRFHRMSGFNTLWQPGVDHAGIATQIVVERQLQEAKISRHDLGREKFLEKVWEWKEKSGQTIVQQMRRLGASVDWQREYFTMEPRLSEVVTQTFVQLYEAGLIYRGKRLVNWDPKLKTAVSDLEVEMIERKGFMWHIVYPFSDGAQKDGHGNVLKGMTIATTRPETMLADGAVCVHPEDERFRHLVGKYVDLPLCDRKIPVIADDFVDREFGSGCVKITGAHDFNDYACALRHQLPLLTIMTESAAINENAPHAYHGLDRYDARKAVVADLAAQGFLQAVKPHVSMVPVCTRTGEIVEPMLTNQWFVDLTRDKLDDGRVGGNQAMVQPALKAVADGAIKLFPEYWVNTYNQWLHNIQDWCISRQLWWGHQIPAWYAENGSVFVAVDEQAAKAKALATGYHGHLTRDADVLDTWFSSALVPFSTLGWPQPQAQEKAIYKLYLPSSVLVTGYDIIFFWVARMVMMTLYFTNKVPFHHVYVHGLVRDAQGKKMSKSEGNTLDPVDLIDGIDLTSLIAKRLTGLRRPELAESIEKHTRAEFPHGIPKFGADALRFTFASLASLGNNINFDSKRCEGYRNFCNKLWNATRFVLMHTQDQDCAIDLNTTPYESSQFSDFDRWIITQLQHTEAAVAQGFADYRLDLVAQSIYQFVWDHYCDWYLEVAKIQLQSSDANIKQATRHVLVQVLEATLRLAHPLIPYITEELWLVVAKVAGKASTSIVLAPYPQSEASKCFAVSETIVAQLQQVITSVRNLRSEMKLAPARKVAMQILGRPTYIHQNLVLIQTLCRLSEVGFFDDELIWQEKIGHAPVLVLEKVRMALSVPIDKAVEQERLNKEKQKLEAEIVKIKTKLQSENFLKKAPAAIVEQEKERLQQFSNILNKITQQLTMIR